MDFIGLVSADSRIETDKFDPLSQQCSLARCFGVSVDGDQPVGLQCNACLVDRRKNSSWWIYYQLEWSLAHFDCVIRW